MARSALGRFFCPKCGASAVAVRTSEVAHRCYRNRNKITQYQLQEEVNE